MYYFKITLLITIIFLVAGCDTASSGNRPQCKMIDSVSPEFELHVSIDQLKVQVDCYMNRVVTVQGILRGDEDGFYLFDQISSVTYLDPSKVINLDATERLSAFPASEISEEKFTWVRVTGLLGSPSLLTDISTVQILDDSYY